MDGIAVKAVGQQAEPVELSPNRDLPVHDAFFKIGYQVPAPSGSLAQGHPQAADAPAATPKGIDAGSVLAPGKHTFGLPDGRSYDVYVPDGLQQPAGVVVAADGLVKTDKEPSTQMGVINGLYREADQDMNHVVVTLNPVKEWSPLFGMFGSFKGWNFPHAATGFDPKGPNDTQYALDTLTDLSKRVNVNLSTTGCEGFSLGAQFLHSLNENRPGVPKETVCKSMAMFSSGVQRDEPITKPGVSELYVFAENSGQYPDGGLDLTTKGGALAKLFNVLVGESDLEHNVPNLLFGNEVKANGMDLSQEHTSHYGFFDKTELTAPDGKTRAIKYSVLEPYSGHYVPGAPSSSAGNPIPRKYLSGAHIAACLFKFGKNCEKEGVD